MVSGVRHRSSNAAILARLIAVLASLALLFVAFTGAAFAQNGNRGTVKIHDGAGEPDPEVRNQPKVCDFHIHAFFFHAEQELTFTIEGHGGPNAGPDTYQNTVITDEDGEARDPATGSISLAEGMYKLTVDTGMGGPGQQNKHKVFKVECPDEAPPPELPDEEEEEEEEEEEVVEEEEEEEEVVEEEEEEEEVVTQPEDEELPETDTNALVASWSWLMLAGGLLLLLLGRAALALPLRKGFRRS
ncbi:MAG: hypothetical protein M3N29_08750 [Chloroflexota bacterium]|nr:hypothetical protein [Chloroflexota bacterium]